MDYRRLLSVSISLSGHRLMDHLLWLSIGPCHPLLDRIFFWRKNWTRRQFIYKYQTHIYTFLTLDIKENGCYLRIVISHANRSIVDSRHVWDNIDFIHVTIRKVQKSWIQVCNNNIQNENFLIHFYLKLYRHINSSPKTII